ncbi:MAG: carbon-nitrogen hydrolase family protein [Alcaligenaceae bacterium]|nr:carbon-nitrogen hydrolase family protein [Alcaligenaceae bacterium]
MSSLCTDVNAGTDCSVAAIQMVSVPDLATNLAQASDLITQAAAAGAKMLVLPEYFCFLGHKDTDKLALREQPGNGPIQRFLADHAQRLGVWIFAGTLPLDTGDPARIYNTLLVFDPSGNVVARYDKIHLFGFRRGEEAYDESRSIKAGELTPRCVDTPCGPAGLSICYDIRFPELYRNMGHVSLNILPAAFTYTTGSAHWEILLRARAIENQCYLVASAQGGRHPNGRRTWGHSMIIDPWGEILDVLPEGPGFVMATLSLDKLASVRQALPALTHRVL